MICSWGLIVFGWVIERKEVNKIPFDRLERTIRANIGDIMCRKIWW